MDAAVIQALELMVFDVDGVLTDGGIYVDGDGGVMKRFSVKDGAGVVALQAAGVPCAILTGRRDPATRQRARELGIERLIEGSKNKGADLTALSLSLAIPLARIGYVGDDRPDLPAIALAGFSAAPSDAAQEVLAAVDHICDHPGGHGAVRALCDQIISMRSAPCCP